MTGIALTDLTAFGGMPFNGTDSAEISPGNRGTSNGQTRGSAGTKYTAHDSDDNAYYVYGLDPNELTGFNGKLVSTPPIQRLQQSVGQRRDARGNAEPSVGLTSTLVLTDFVQP